MLICNAPLYPSFNESEMPEHEGGTLIKVKLGAAPFAG
jgi:hypothetical protein